LVNGFAPTHTTLLTQNYRSHPQLLTAPNALFYGGALRAAADPVSSNAFLRWEGLTDAARAVPGGFPLLWHGVEGRDAREADSPSWFNAQEASAVYEHVRSILDHRGGGVTPADVGVITPYHKQAVKIRSLLGNRGLKAVEVGSVEVFQGREKAAIVLSAVRSSSEHLPFDARHALGFLANPKRFNVAVTRAKALLVVVGNPAILGRDPHWAALLAHCVKHGAYKGCQLPDWFDATGGGLGSLPRAMDALLGDVDAEEAARAAEAGGESLRQLEEGPAWSNEAC